jgi:hypothetical protein
MKTTNLSKLSKNIGGASNAVGIVMTLKDFYELYKEHEQTNREIKKYEETKNILVAEMNLHYQLIHDAMNRVFSERKETIDKFFGIIETGIKEKNDQYVLAGLKGVSEIVSTSPFSNLETLGNLLNSGKKIEI